MNGRNEEAENLSWLGIMADMIKAEYMPNAAGDVVRIVPKPTAAPASKRILFQKKEAAAQNNGSAFDGPR